MPLITLADADAACTRVYAKRLQIKAAAKILDEDTPRGNLSHEFDVFLSHSYKDVKLNKKRLLGIKALLEEYGLGVYVDWIIDSDLNRKYVSAKTAATLRTRMDHSKCLFFATSETSSESKWMPWELGYLDGQKQRVAILPLVATTGKYQFKGQEYLGVYPYIEQAAEQKTQRQRLWVCRDQDTYVAFDEWLRGKEPWKRAR